MDTLKQNQVLAAVMLILCATSVQAEDWRTLRGPHFDGSASLNDAAIATGALKLKTVWKQPFGSGYSGASIAGDRLVSAMADKEANQEFLVAKSVETGETLWRSATGKIMVGENGSFDGPIATPAIDEERAYHLSPHGNLAAYDIATGGVVWAHDLKSEYGAEPNFYGFGACPILHAGLLIVPVGAPDAMAMAFDPATGNVIWKAGNDGAAFHAALPVTVDSKTAVILAGNTTLHAIEPLSGEVLWSQPHGGASGGMVFSIVPVPLGDGGLFINDRRDESTLLDLRVSGATTRWSGRDIRNTYCVPVMAGGMLCSYSSRFLVAVDPATGERAWRTRSPGNGFLATIAGRLVSSTIDGSLHIGDVTEEGFSEVASLQVFDTGPGAADGLTWSLPAISGRSIYLRSLGAIARVDVLPGDGDLKVASESSSVGPEFAAFLNEVKVSDDKQAVVDRFLNGKPSPLHEGDHVHFILQGDYQDVAVASDIFGVRQERAMQKLDGTDLHYFGVSVPGLTRASYVYYADYKPMVDPKNDRSVVSSTLSGEMEPSFLAPAEKLTFSWFQKGEIAGITPDTDSPSAELAGQLARLPFQSQLMNETFQLSIYTPPGYEDSDGRYPIVFVHDGGVAKESGNQAVILDDLIRGGFVRPSIAVFIEKRFYPLQGPGAYPQMFASELVPKMLASYRVSSDRMDRASLSGGFGATLALISTLPASEQIGRLGCHSPFAFEMLHPALKGLASLPNQRCEVRVDWGDFELRNPSENWNMADQAKVVSEILRQGGHEVTAESAPTGTDWVCWRTRSQPMWQFLVGGPR